ncbi:hypothetical protein 2050HW_00143 [Serratia phage vB_SmaM_ 2050HW]|uniref:Uncharacterized protein n=1 Tax=Serratia phage vB_SmaM_ 2050HW TaxID=2024252 RepID=A0A289ZTT8_9CAUD|nr:hypothetical protein HWB23_gp143 [Serratia phage vB_SmaM_ 2050HW]ATA65478.1 hypothetical protein 2050HW_00143 [Serratia phage vB_SmaM_ 2050HW]UCR74744.1 hypothetical protein [Serratia phage BUCT660]UQT03612.1 hypothetical protein KODAMA_01450 [Serratia phage vB_SmaM-Kodama]
MASFEVNGEGNHFSFGDSVLGQSLASTLGVFVFPCAELKNLSYAIGGTPDIILNDYTDKSRKAKMVYKVPVDPWYIDRRVKHLRQDYFNGLAIPLKIASNKSDTIKEMRVVLEDNGGNRYPIIALQIRFDEHGVWHTLNNSEGISGIVKFVKSLN